MLSLLFRRSLLTALAGLVCTLSPCAADNQAQFGAETPFFEDLPTVLSASRLPQVLNEAPGAVTILDRHFIQATGYRDIARLLRLVPGMQIGQERGHSQWVTYHGLGSDYPTEIQVLVDGRSVYAPSAFGGVGEIAQQAELNAKTLYRTLSPKGNPELRSLTAILKAMGLRLAIEPMDHDDHPHMPA